MTPVIQGSDSSDGSTSDSKVTSMEVDNKPNGPVSESVSNGPLESNRLGAISLLHPPASSSSPTWSSSGCCWSRRCARVWPSPSARRRSRVSARVRVSRSCFRIAAATTRPISRNRLRMRPVNPWTEQRQGLHQVTQLADVAPPARPHE